ncbi:2TM domain-containing protein [Polaribacter litorisediminis]|uniref:2TM domain-containing protein n=1 Tax=Polaribacter litorisediminis TaxID=1908341 RepID=UPI001CBF5581|nr:2TM domain-containing protein [Polaribacter litorisediminis]UAM99870.1 2TM domain-containing protein [Polaribacter litorisediminis]
MKNELTQEQRYVLARRKVNKISKFYKNLAAYILVNIFLTTIFIAGNIHNGDSFREALLNPYNYIIWFFWGLSIGFQFVTTFGLSQIFNKRWEERKIKQFIKEYNT